jgi:hypothetical protein
MTLCAFALSVNKKKTLSDPNINFTICLPSRS